MSHRFDDPGWPWLDGLLGILPFAGLILARRTKNKSLLTIQRGLFLRLVEIPFMLLFVLTFINGEPDVTFGAVHATIICMVGAASLLASEYFAKRLARAKTDAEAVGLYRAIFALRFALCDVPMLLGFVLFFLNETGLPIYLVGLLFTEVGLIRMAPTRGAIDRAQRLLPAHVHLGQLLSTAEPLS